MMNFDDQSRNCHSERSEESETVCKEVSFGLESHCFSVILNAHERFSHSLRFFAALRMTLWVVIVSLHVIRKHE